MSKIILGFLIALIAAAAGTSSVKAQLQCEDVMRVNTCRLGLTQCLSGGNVVGCCLNPQDCNTYQPGSTPGTTGGGDREFEMFTYDEIVCNGTGIRTALGCLQAEPAAFLRTLLSFGIGIAGGIAFLLIIVGGFQMMTSAGNPEQLMAGRELAISALVGLLLIIFSVFLLRMLGYSILRIPGFG